MENLALEYLVEKGFSLEEYKGSCVELVDEVLHWLWEKGIDAESMLRWIREGRLRDI